MKKNSITILLLMICFLVTAQEKDVDIETLWLNSYKEALKKAKKERKPVLIYFKGSDWCGPCKKLDEGLFISDKFKKIAKKNFILYEADNPYNKDLVEADRLKVNLKLVKKFKISSYPTLLFVNHRQKIIAYKKGMILTDYYYPFFQSVLSKFK
ncbi:protein-disulfide isomerase [Tenacibaculum sp. Bg11-29]|uniref:thioredoxin family protein n=1 Tax=Tenacibaculum sp. Bg11-29 TaxID=2058306 RepID=UPI000C3437EB|nr:thioredoxin family protein [Tenacibaculum sp. Bg11-29]PKH51158.1 protein-disulfide isomerase [Tenacibaculum sp. Bg11-29]